MARFRRAIHESSFPELKFVDAPAKPGQDEIGAFAFSWCLGVLAVQVCWFPIDLRATRIQVGAE
jgi:hypothetical protein